jgi:hypothetical protein
VLVGVFDVCPECADTVHLYPLCSEVEGHTEAAQGGCDLRQRRSRRDERGEGHVARRTTHGLEMNVGQDLSPGSGATGLRWERVFGAWGTAPLFLSSVGDPAHSHKGDGQADGK